MRVTSIKNNYEFKRAYAKGKSAAAHNLVLYVRKNRLAENRLGVTVSQKVGCAVVRNRARRLIKEAYRLNAEKFTKGNDIVAVARGKTPHCKLAEIEKSLIFLGNRLGIVKDTP